MKDIKRFVVYFDEGIVDGPTIKILEGESWIDEDEWDFEEDFKKELRRSPQIKELEIKRLKELYECKCHKTCLTIYAKLYSEELTCGEKCDRTFLDLSCSMFRKKKRCERMLIKRKYNIDDEALLLHIVINPDYSPPKTKSSKKNRRKTKVYNDNHIV